MNTLKEQFSGLREDVTLLRQDLQKIRERTTAVESRVSDTEDKLQLLRRPMPPISWLIIVQTTWKFACDATISV